MHKPYARNGRLYLPFGLEQLTLDAPEAAGLLSDEGVVLSRQRDVVYSYHRDGSRIVLDHALPELASLSSPNAYSATLNLDLFVLDNFAHQFKMVKPMLIDVGLSRANYLAQQTRRIAKNHPYQPQGVLPSELYELGREGYQFTCSHMAGMLSLCLARHEIPHRFILGHKHAPEGIASHAWLEVEDTDRTRFWFDQSHIHKAQEPADIAKLLEASVCRKGDDLPLFEELHFDRLGPVIAQRILASSMLQR